MGRWGALRVIVAVCGGTLAAACSSASYEAPVGKFAAATQTAETSLNKLNDDIRKAYWDVQKARIGRGEFMLRQVAGDCVTVAPKLGDARPETRCRLEMVDRQGKARPFDELAPLDEMVELMAGIREYADGLSAIVQAKTAQAVQGHVNTALGSVHKLATTVAKASGAPAPTDFASPLAQVVNWFVGQYVERVKVSGLRRATEAAEQEAIPGAVKLLRSAAFFAGTGTEVALANQLTSSIEPLGRRPSAAEIDRAATAARTFDNFLRADSGAVFDAMGRAHAALAKRLAQKDVSFAEMAAEIERFAAEAEKLARAVIEIQKLLNPEP